MTAIAVIPARFHSTRFPGKILADKTGRPLIQHVYEQTLKAKRITSALVATDDDRIASAVRAFGGQVVLTRADHANGTSRIAEAVQNLPHDIIVNVQGDEPEIDPHIIDLAVETILLHRDCQIATVASPFAPHEDPANLNIVKVVLDAESRALYFSRALIPFNRDSSGTGMLPVRGDANLRPSHLTLGNHPSTSTPSTTPHEQFAQPLKHIGLYVYRREFLLTYPSLAPTPLERAEQLEQLRFLEHGFRIAVAVSPTHHHGIDTPEQYEAFVNRFRKAPLPSGEGLG